MKSRAILMGLFATIALTSGSGCVNNPCWGWRLHPCAYCRGAAAPAPAVVAAPVAFRIPTGPVGGPECASCGCGGGMTVQPPIYGGPAPTMFPEGSGPPVIGNPMPLPGMSFGNSSLVPSPMPTVINSKN